MTTPPTSTPQISSFQQAPNGIWVHPGIYRHFKGGLYQVLGVALPSSESGRVVVYLDQQFQLWWRDLGDFVAIVEHPDTKRPVQRFILVQRT